MRYIHQFISLLITLLVAFTGGLIFQRFNFPAPYLLGGLVTTFLLGRLVGPATFALAIPRWFQLSVLALMSVLIGATFSPQIIGALSKWSGSLISMIIVTLISTTCGYLYLKKCRHYDHNLAILCSLPGGQAEIVATSIGLVKKDYVVAFCHLIRVTLVFCLTPLILALVKGEQGVTQSNLVLNDLPGIFDLPVEITFQLILLGISGYALAHLIRLPMPHLLGPMILSGGLHIYGLINIPRISELVIIAQLTISGIIGTRLSQVKISELASHLGDAFVNATITISIFCLAALVLSSLGLGDFILILLAFIPGGLYEVSLLALIFGYDLAFVAFHHCIRFILIFILLPWLIKSS